MTQNPNPNPEYEKLANVQVGVRPELQISRQIFQGEPAYVIQDPITFASHDLTVDAYQIFVSIEDNRKLSDIFVELIDRGVLAEDDGDTFYGLVVQFNQLGLLNLPVSDGKALFARFQQKESARNAGWLMRLLIRRVPLFQPDHFLTNTVKFVSPLFTRAAFSLWLCGIVLLLYIVWSRWDRFSSPLATMLTQQNLPLLWTLVVGLKIVHEFGHAYACKHFGGRVPEMGAFFIVFTPCAYVDASASWGFSNRGKRIIVSLAGMYFESIIAILAAIVWCLTGPSTLHSAAQYVIVLSTAVTIGFNLNPLMKYDGYYVLSDVANIPNIWQRSQAELRLLLKSALFGITQPSPTESPQLRFLLVAYAATCVCYRVVVIVGISAMIAMTIPYAGIAVAVFFVFHSVWQQGSKLLRFLFTSEETLPVRRRALVVSSCLAASALILVSMIPISFSVLTVGVLGQQSENVIRAPASGFLNRVDVSLGDAVSEGMPIGTVDHFEQQALLAQKRAQIEELRLRLHDQLATNPRSAYSTDLELIKNQRELAQLQDEVDSLVITSPQSGIISWDQGVFDVGRYLHEGEKLATVSSGDWVVRAITDQESWARSKPEIGSEARVFLNDQSGKAITGKVVSCSTLASRRIDEIALTQLGGGTIQVGEGGEAEQPYFEIKVKIDQDALPEHIGKNGLTAWTRFPGEKLSLGARLYRRLLRFMQQLEVNG